MTTSEFLDLPAIAERMGLREDTVRAYHTHAQQRRNRGESRPGDFPPPDARFGGRTPVWYLSTFETWLANRPGRGAGGGPKPRKAQQ